MMSLSVATGTALLRSRDQQEWRYSMTESSTLSEQEAHDLAAKLRSFTETLPPREQEALAQVVARGLGLAEEVAGYSLDYARPLYTRIYIPEYFYKFDFFSPSAGGSS
jgi:hypothetical protein